MTKQKFNLVEARGHLLKIQSELTAKNISGSIITELAEIQETLLDIACDFPCKKCKGMKHPKCGGSFSPDMESIQFDLNFDCRACKGSGKEYVRD